jgi:hypothetical protein
MARICKKNFPTVPTLSVAGFQPNVVPLPHLDLGPKDCICFPLLEESSSNKQQHSNMWNSAELEAVQMIEEQCAVVKTIKNSDWTPFLHQFHGGGGCR